MQRTNRFIIEILVWTPQHPYLFIIMTLELAHKIFCCKIWDFEWMSPNQTVNKHQKYLEISKSMKKITWKGKIFAIISKENELITKSIILQSHYYFIISKTCQKFSLLEHWKPLHENSKTCGSSSRLPFAHFLITERQG